MPSGLRFCSRSGTHCLGSRKQKRNCDPIEHGGVRSQLPRLAGVPASPRCLRGNQEPGRWGPGEAAGPVLGAWLSLVGGGAWVTLGIGPQARHRPDWAQWAQPKAAPLGAESQGQIPEMVRGRSSCRERPARFCGLGCEAGMRGAGWAPFSQTVRPAPIQWPLRGGSALPSSCEGTRPRLLITTNWVNAEMIPLPPSPPSPPRGNWELQRGQRDSKAAWPKWGHQGGAGGAEGSRDQAWAHMASSPTPSLLAWGCRPGGIQSEGPLEGSLASPVRISGASLAGREAGRQGRASWDQEQ